MTSTISLNKINSVIKKNFRLNAASLTVTNVLAILGMVLVAYITIGIENIKAAQETSVFSDVTSEYITGTVVVFGILGIIQLFFLPIKMFREIYSRRASDFFYSMPITRKEYYIGNVFYGIINVLLLMAVVIVSALITSKMPGLFDIKHNYLLLRPFFSAVLLCAVSIIYEFSIFILSAVLCGKIWQVITVSLVGISSFSMLCGGIEADMNTIYGFYSDAAKNQDGISNMIAMFNGENTGNIIASAALYLAASAVVLGIGYFVFKHRKAETAEQSLSGKIMPCMLLSFICASVFITFSEIGTNTAAKILFGVIAGVIAAVIFCAIFYKKAFTKSTAVSAAIVCAVMSLFVICVDVLPEKVGYTNYVPKAEDVQEIAYEKADDNYKYTESGVSAYIDSLFLSYGYYDEGVKWSIKSEEGINAVIALHSKAVSDDVVKKYKSYYSFDEYSDDFEYIDDWYSFKLIYTLKNGKTVTRCYAVDVDDMFDEYAALVKTDEVMNQREPFTIDTASILFARLDMTDTDTVDVDYYDDSVEEGIYYSDDSYFKLESYEELFERLKKDIYERDKQNLLYYDDGIYYCQDLNNFEDSQSISIYYIDESCPAEEAEKIRKMTPSQLQKYVYQTSDVYVNEAYFSFSANADKNVTEFLADKGILK